MPNYRKIILTYFLIFSASAEFSCDLCAMTVIMAQQSQSIYVTIYDVLDRRLNTVHCISTYIIDGAVPLRVAPYFHYTSTQYFGNRALRFKTASECDSEPVGHLSTQSPYDQSSYLHLILSSRHFPRKSTKFCMSCLV
jgi:hypothetical protein